MITDIENTAIGLAYRLVDTPSQDERFRIFTTTIRTVDESERNELILHVSSALAAIAQGVIDTHNDRAWIADRIAAHASVAELATDGIPPDTP